MHTCKSNCIEIIPVTIASFWCICVIYIHINTYLYYICANLPLHATPYDLFGLGKATPSLTGMCAEINAHRGGFLAYHRMDDYAMPSLMRQGIEKLEKRREARGWSASSVGFRRVRNAFERDDGRVSPRDRRMYRVVCLFVQGRHCVPRQFPTRATISCLSRVLFCFCSKKAFWDPQHKDQA